jgi:hypothetical protein
MIRISAASSIALALALAAAMPATGAHAADTNAPYKKGTHARHSSVGRPSSGQPAQNPKPGAGPIAGSRSDTSPPSGSAPPTNEPSAPTGH